MLQSVKDSSLAEWDSKHLLLLSPLLWLASYTPGTYHTEPGPQCPRAAKTQVSTHQKVLAKTSALAPAWQFTSLQPAGSLPSWHSFLVCRMRVTVSVSLMLGMCCDSAVFPPCRAGWCGERAVWGCETGCLSAETFTLVSIPWGSSPLPFLRSDSFRACLSLS